MKVGIIGTGERAETRARVVREAPGVVFVGYFETDPVAEADPALDVFLGQVDVVMVTVPTAIHYHVAEMSAKRGVHVFTEWPPATSIRECEAMVRLAEEAGVEAGVSRPLRFHPIFDALRPTWQAHLILLHQVLAADGPVSWPRELADAVDLCSALARDSGVQRIDAEAVRAGQAWPEAVAFGVRFHSGTYAQVSIRRGGLSPVRTLYVAGSGMQLEAHLDGETVIRYEALADEENAATPSAFVPSSPDPLSPIEAETRAFLHALVEKRPVPVSMLEGLHTMRLVERLMGRLR